ncbi:MAG: OmpA family protein [Saprospiraceae bacterium]|nr:OmpA family protein [Saprospiraceae bacterium]
MLRNIYNILTVFSITITVGFSQPVQVASYDMMIETAENAAQNYDYYNAIEWFDKAHKESKDPSLLVTMADLHMLLRDYVKAERLYDRVLKRDKMEEFTEVRLDYARSLKYQAKYKQALDVLNEFISITDNEELKSEAKVELDGLLMLGKYAENIEAVVSFAGENVNSGSAESSPALYVDGTLYYSSFNRKNEIIFDGDEGDFHAKLYTSARNIQGGYDKAVPLGEHINRAGFNAGGVSFSSDGNKMYFTRAKLKSNGIELSELYVSQREGGVWNPPVAIKELNGDFKILHPYEGELYGNKVLYFACDMPGGFGGYDIYYSTIKGNEFAIPINLGPNINTAKNEISPFYKEGTLYFSSNGHAGMGGFDVYFATWTGSVWEGLMNMGHNYNTSYDDMFLRFNTSGNAGFVVSNRPHKDKKKLKGSDTCCDDIYIINIRDLIIDLQALVEGEAGPLEGATIELLEGAKLISVDSKSNFNGNNFSFLLDPDKNYKAVVTREGYFPDSITFNTNGIFDDYTFKKTIKLNPKPREAEFDTYTINEAIRLNNIYYDFDDDKILPDAEKDLSYLVELMDKYPDMVIELSSHTDSRGVSTYNQKLSQRRAESAKNWLGKEGVDVDRIKPVGYGESKLLNKCSDGVRCSEEEHRFNRRTEFKIIAGPQTIEIQKSRLTDKQNTKG